MIRYLGIVVFLTLVMSHGSVYQIAILAFVVLSHSAIDLYRAYYTQKQPEKNIPQTPEP